MFRRHPWIAHRLLDRAITASLLGALLVGAAIAGAHALEHGTHGGHACTICRVAEATPALISLSTVLAEPRPTQTTPCVEPCAAPACGQPDTVFARGPPRT